MFDNKRWRLAFLVSTFALGALAWGMTASAARGQSELPNHRPGHRLKPVTPPPGYVSPTVASLRLQPAGAEVEYWVRVTQNDYALQTCPSQLTVIEGPPGHQKQIYEYKSCDWLQYMLPGGDGSALITVWETGSAIETRVFRVLPGHVSLTLERGTHLPPEFTLDGILINSGWVPVGDRCCTADKTEIWAWGDGKYKLAATVPFDERYRALAKLDDQGMKK